MSLADRAIEEQYILQILLRGVCALHYSCEVVFYFIKNCERSVKDLPLFPIVIVGIGVMLVLTLLNHYVHW